MNIVCVICSDLLTPSDDIFHTPCGHIFHYTCLVQWLERSRSCPQCREKTTEQKIHRIYFNFSNNDSIKEDATSLQNRIDNLNFQLKLKDKNLNNLTEANEKLKGQTISLRHEIHKIESEINGKTSAIHALKEQVKFYKQQCSDADNFRKENEHLKKHLEFLKNIENLIDNSTCEIDDVIMGTEDASKLKIYVSVLKREVKQMSDRSRELREKYKNLQKEHIQVCTENKQFKGEYAKRKELEERLMIQEHEKIALQTQLFDMQKNAFKYAKSKISAEEREILKTHTVDNVEKFISKCTSKHEDTLKLDSDDSCIIIDPANETQNTPQSIKSQSFFSTRNHIMKRQKSDNNLKVPSILAKKSRFNQSSQKTASDNGMSFDGFGGHAKYDKFPNLFFKSHKGN